MNIITIIRRDGFLISIYKTVADQLNLKDFQRVDDETADKALFLNISHGIAICKAMTTNPN